LKLLMATLFLPEGLSLFVGDFRLPPVRILLIFLSIAAVARFVKTHNLPDRVRTPSDFFALAAGFWMILAMVVSEGVADGLKGGTALAIDFTGAYLAFRYLLGTVDSSVQVIRYASIFVVIAVGLAFFDPLTGQLFTYEMVKKITGYVKPGLEEMFASGAESVFRNGTVRAQGPLEHSILLGAVCAWFGTLALFTFPRQLFGKSIAAVALVGILISQARGPLVAYAMGIGLAAFYASTKQFPARWKVLGSLVAVGLLAVLVASRNPVATLLQLGGLDPSAGWYREAIWETAGPVVLQSPLFGIGLADWGWEQSDVLLGSTVDSLWLATALIIGIPSSILVCLTMIGAFWTGPIDGSPSLSPREQRLSVALGIVVSTAVFLGFTVHFWGACWILLGAFPGMRANLAEAAIIREREAALHLAELENG
jgi:O-antigen ligase